MKKTDIKTNLKLNYEDLGYTPNPPTDDEIYYYWGLKLIKGIRSKPTWASGRRDAMKGATREELIEYAKEFAPPLPPDETINKVREKRVASRLRAKEKPKFTGFRFGV